jgi:hypothetical protein
VLELPGVAGDAEDLGLGEVPLADLGGAGLADDDRTGLAQASDRLGVMFGDSVLAGAAEGGGVAGEVDVVLDRHRHSEQRCPLALTETAIGLGGVGQRLLAADQPEGVERRLRRLDPLQ